MLTSSAPSPPAPVPPEIDRWNWGAFLLSWIWGIGNNTLIALLAFIPLVGFVMMFVLGAKGSAWAWSNKRWESVEHFKRVQRNWAIAGVVFWLALIVFFTALYFFIAAVIKSSDVYQAAIAKTVANAEAARGLGKPMNFGFPMGSIQISGPSGTAKLSIPVEGSKAKGTVYLDAVKEMGEWRFKQLQLEIEGREERIDLETGRKVPSGRGQQVMRFIPARAVG
jgi:Cytochrome oxidase complex assembly protein 1